MIFHNINGKYLSLPIFCTFKKVCEPYIILKKKLTKS
jgi:hypothetical protein